jgi:potassium efflux system protein
VRTVLNIGVSYAGDPHEAKQAIQDAVGMQPEVLPDPPPQVLLHNFGDSSVDFRVLYYMNVAEFSRLIIKSNVMFAIWDALKKAHIEIPFPQRDIHIRELPPQTPLSPAPQSAPQEAPAPE